jgi:predicted transcriptional regulator
MLVTPLQKLLATKAIALMPGLSTSERRVAVAIIDHFRREDGRCDPGIDRLAEELDIDRRTVLRSVHKLDRLEIVHKDRHQGRYRTNSYEPNWKRLDEIEREWRQRLSRTARKRGTNQPLHQGQNKASAGDGPVTQTCSLSLSEEPVASSTVSADSARLSEMKLSNGQARRALSKSVRRALQRMTSREAAEQSALQRWDADLREQDRALYGAIVNAIDDAAISAITAAEVRRRGGGLEYIVEHLEQLLAKGNGHG